MARKDVENLVAKVKFWFGRDQEIFDRDRYDVEYDGSYAFIWKKKKMGKVL